MNVSNEAYEMQGCTGPPKTSTDDDQDEQFWNDIKAETGYSSYKSYVETLARSGQGLGKLLNHLNFSGLSDAKGEIVVLDIQKDGSTVTSFSAIYSEGKPPRTSQGSQLENASKMSYRLLQNLRSPPEDIPARIVLWSITRGSRPDGGIIEALGLGLDIDPSFFEILVQMNPLLKKRHWRWYTEQAEQAVRTKQAMGSNQVTIGDSIVTIAQEYRRERHPPPVLVIAGSFDMDMGFWIDDRALDQPYHGIVNDEVHWEFSGGTSLFRSATDRVLTNDLASVPSNYYLKLLSKYVYKDCYDDAEVDTEFDTILLIAVLPLLRLEIFRLRGLCTTMRSALRLVQFDVEDPGWTVEREKVERYTALDRYRFWLRRRLENLQESRDTFQNLARSQNAAHWLGTKQWLRQDADIGEALVMARAKEAEVRDYMQLQIGNLSISESRKSIQLSNQQMNEAKRVRILTILAFVYVPINLASSIFGMNLQQLNQSGQNLWSFVATALVSLLVTAFLWFLLELYNIIVDWKRKLKELGLRTSEQKPRRSVAFRVAVFLGLIDEEFWDFIHKV